MNQIKEEELENVAGGIESPFIRRCHFTNGNQVKTMTSPHGWSGKWKLCKSRACNTCICAFCDICIDKWHRVDANEELFPADRGNHKDKPRSNNYNTPTNPPGHID